MTNITLWVPAAESPKWPCVMSWLNMEYPDDCRMTFVRSGANNVKYSWNKVIKDFLETDSEWILSSHNDVVFHPGTLPRLLSWNQPLVSALIFHRQSPTIPHIWRGETPGQRPYVQRIQETRQWFMQHMEYIQPGPQLMEPRPDDALIETDFTSTSCTLIHRSVLESMKKDCGEMWFQWDDDYGGGGEDRRFFEIARRVGFTPYIDRSCIVGHIVGDIPTSAMDFMMWTQSSNFTGTGEE